jgi:formylglycine-generating enzyme required for sulfatase activity
MEMRYIITFIFGFILFRCGDVNNPKALSEDLSSKLPMCHQGISGEEAIQKSWLEELNNLKPDSGKAGSHRGMVFVPEGSYFRGATEIPNDRNPEPGSLPRKDEYPVQKVKIPAFYIDSYEVTNKEFDAFVRATGWITIAERPIDAVEIAGQLPPGTPLPDPESLKPGSLVFREVIPQEHHFSEWWTFVQGANWRHPQGPGSHFLADHPVVHVSWYDAMAFCTWSGKRLPSESEWEYAGRGGRTEALYAWGNSAPGAEKSQGNYWQGSFPENNTGEDGFLKTSPVGSFRPNEFGLYDMSGNVWEWCNDWYHWYAYACDLERLVTENPTGPTKSFDPSFPNTAQKTMRGGSFLCNDSYCAGYRLAARMKSSPDTGSEHAGFRCAKSIK